MRRREFITLASSAAIAWPFAALAQQGVPVIGLLDSASLETRRGTLSYFFQGLKQAGYVEGHNIAIEYRWAEGKYDRLPGMAMDLVRRDVAVIVAVGGTASALATKGASLTIPIVFSIGADPVKFGLVASLNQPGGNVTGVTFLQNLLPAKQVEVLHEMVPAATVIGFLVNPTNPNAESDTKEVTAAAVALRQRLLVLNATSEPELEAAFTALVQEGAGGLLTAADPFFTGRRDRIVALSKQHSVPTFHDNRVFALAGALLSYGPQFTEGYRQIGLYVGRILKGAKPSELPVHQPAKFELVVNLKTAKALGLTVPPTLLARADEVIE
jgi:putative ABC transport system substrate-binding protein